MTAFEREAVSATKDGLYTLRVLNFEEGRKYNACYQ